MIEITYILLAVIVAVILIDLYLKRKNKLATTKDIEKVVDKDDPEKNKWWEKKVVIIISSVVLGAGVTVFILAISNESLNLFNSAPEETIEEVVACADNCQKACCLGCTALEGEAVCLADHSCCSQKVIASPVEEIIEVQEQKVKPPKKKRNNPKFSKQEYFNSILYKVNDLFKEHNYNESKFGEEVTGKYWDICKIIKYEDDHALVMEYHSKNYEGNVTTYYSRGQKIIPFNKIRDIKHSPYEDAPTNQWANKITATYHQIIFFTSGNDVVYNHYNNGVLSVSSVKTTENGNMLFSPKKYWDQRSIDKKVSIIYQELKSLLNDHYGRNF